MVRLLPFLPNIILSLFLFGVKKNMSVAKEGELLEEVIEEVEQLEKRLESLEKRVKLGVEAIKSIKKLLTELKENPV